MSIEYSAPVVFYVSMVLFFISCYQSFSVLEKLLGEAFVVGLKTVSEVSYHLPGFFWVHQKSASRQRWAN